MRTLCLCLPPAAAPSSAEHFLRFSPRVQFRAPGLLFLDIASTAKLFGGERELLLQVQQVARGWAEDAPIAISDTPWGAQVIARETPGFISLPTQEMHDLVLAPLARLHELEGLQAWRSTEEIARIVGFFHQLGLRRLGEIRIFKAEAFLERWQEVGLQIWKRLHGLDHQPISPLLPTDALIEYVNLDFPISVLQFLLHGIEKCLVRLMSRLQGRGEFAKKLLVRLFCEYSERVHVFELAPASPGRNLELFMKLLEHKLSPVNLDNPIKQMELEVIPCPEKLQQLSFFEPRVSENEKLSELVSVFNQAELKTGFLQPCDEVMPEHAWRVTPGFVEAIALEDEVAVDGDSFQVRPSYGATLRQAPRPSRLLKTPCPLGREIERYQMLSQQPIERLEDAWWESARGRDYYFALSPRGQFVWLFYDRLAQQYFLHGYFD